MPTPRMKTLKGHAQEIPFPFNQDKAAYWDVGKHIGFHLLIFQTSVSFQVVILWKVQVRSALALSSRLAFIILMTIFPI